LKVGVAGEAGVFEKVDAEDALDGIRGAPRPSCGGPLPPGDPSPAEPAAEYEALGNRAAGWAEAGGVARSKSRSVDVEETSPDDVVGRDEGVDNKSGPDGERRCDGGRSSLQSSMTVRRLDWGLDSEPYS